MNATRMLHVLLASLLAALLVAGVACGGDDDEEEEATPSPTEEEDGGDGGDLEAYFLRLEDLVEASSDDSDTLQEDYPDYFGDREQAEAYYSEVDGLFGQLVNDVEDIDPPAEVEDAHNDLLASLQDLEEIFPGLVDQLTELESDADLEDFYDIFFSDEDYLDATERYGQACAELQEIADDNDIDVDLQCEVTVEETEAPTALTLEEYFSQIDELFEDSDERIDSLSEDLTTDIDAATTVDEQVDILQTYLIDIDLVFFNVVLTMSTMDVPAEVEILHNDFIDTIEDAAQAGRDLSDALTTATTGAEVEQFVSQFDAEISTISTDSDLICLDLQEIADDEGIDVDLNCED